jgi:hypothetical protein
MTRFGQRLEDWELLFYTSLNRAVKVVLWGTGYRNNVVVRVPNAVDENNPG